MDVHKAQITRGEAERLARTEYAVRRGDWGTWLCCSRGSDGGMHLRATTKSRAQADAWLEERVEGLTGRILMGRSTVYLTAGGRWELA